MGKPKINPIIFNKNPVSIQQDFYQPKEVESVPVSEAVTVDSPFEQNEPLPIEQTRAKDESLVNWNIEELVLFFENKLLLDENIIISPGITIVNPALFVKSHLAFVKANNGKRVFIPYLERLRALKEYITVKTS